MVELNSERSYSKDECIYLAKLYEKAERYDEMIRIISLLVQKNNNLNGDEKSLLSSSFKKVISKRRNSLKFIYNLESQEKKNNSKNIKFLLDVKTKIENEIRKIADDILFLLEHYLLSNKEIDLDSKIFYLKLKADYHRYLAEISVENEKEKEIDNAEETYLLACDLAVDLKFTNPVRLGLALNLSVFYYEIKNNKDEACRIAKQTMEDTMRALSDLEKSPHAKDSLMIIQILKENYYEWSNDLYEQEN